MPQPPYARAGLLRRVPGLQISPSSIDARGGDVREAAVRRRCGLCGENVEL